MATSATAVTYYRGDSYSKEFTILDEETKDPINITGYDVIMVVDQEKVPADNTTEMFTISGTIIDALNGVVSFTPSSDNNDMPEKTYYYRIKMTLNTTIRTVIRDKYAII